MDRAYSVLSVRTVTPELRTFEGLATTPAPDRMGDVIESRGATFSNPIPLLLFHDHKRPIGTVTLGPITDEGISFRAVLPTIAEPGTLRDRVEEAWQSIKAAIIRGVSIGFRALENGIERMKGGGLRFTEFEILELSLVAVPANSEARIETIKSLDAPYLAASAPGAAARGPTQVKPIMKTQTTLEQIAGWQGKRQAKSARMAELMSAASDQGVTLDETQAAEYDGLEREVEDIDRHVSRLEKAEAANRAAAKPISGNTSQAASESRAASSSRIELRESLPPGIEFARMLICKIVSFQNQFSVSPLTVARQRYPDNHRIQNYLERAAVPAGTTTDPTWAGALVDPTNLTQEFLAYLRPQTIVGKFGMGNVPNLRRVPFNVRIPSQTSGGAGYWVGQGKAKPLTKFDFTATTLGWAKVAAISVITEELARFSSPSAEGMVRDGLRDALVERLDIDFVDPAKAAVANVSPASITNGVAPLTSSGSTADAIRQDVEALIASFVAANQDVAKLVLIMPNTLALSLSLLRNSLGTREFPDLTLQGGTLEGIPVIASQYAKTAADGNLVIAANADSIGLADDGAVSVEASREASLEMDSAPTGSSGTPTGASLVSMWQTNSIALKGERYINWAKLRTGAVSYMRQVDWTLAPGS